MIEALFARLLALTRKEGALVLAPLPAVYYFGLCHLRQAASVP